MPVTGELENLTSYVHINNSLHQLQYSSGFIVKAYSPNSLVTALFVYFWLSPNCPRGPLWGASSNRARGGQAEEFSGSETFVLTNNTALHYYYIITIKEEHEHAPGRFEVSGGRVKVCSLAVA